MTFQKADNFGLCLSFYGFGDKKSYKYFCRIILHHQTEHLVEKESDNFTSSEFLNNKIGSNKNKKGTSSFSSYINGRDAEISLFS